MNIDIASFVLGVALGAILLALGIVVQELRGPRSEIAEALDKLQDTIDLDAALEQVDCGYPDQHGIIVRHEDLIWCYLSDQIPEPVWQRFLANDELLRAKWKRYRTELRG